MPLPQVLRTRTWCKHSLGPWEVFVYDTSCYHITSTSLIPEDERACTKGQLHYSSSQSELSLMPACLRNQPGQVDCETAGVIYATGNSVPNVSRIAGTNRV